MSDRLRELLSETPTEDRLSLDGRFLRDMRNRSESRMDVDYDTVKVARFRSALVRATLQEAAKLVCPLCDIGYPLVLGLNDGETGSQHEHENRGYNQGKCLADKIHALLAKEKP